ncbi:ATPase 5 [Tanacetum coccineum]|uniref:ATPase 5 n=1 Tax=Tanacetum coccineum TaxID=301880 RepID=A0ABQ5AYU8_9ASTR
MVHTCGMTGDGVNDASTLKKGGIRIANADATDTTRDASVAKDVAGYVKDATMGSVSHKAKIAKDAADCITFCYRMITYFFGINTLGGVSSHEVEEVCLLAVSVSIFSLSAHSDCTDKSTHTSCMSVYPWRKSFVQGQCPKQKKVAARVNCSQEQQPQANGE